MMGIAIFALWQKRKENLKAKKAITWFFIQLFFNAIWTPIFFGMMAPLSAFFVIVLLWFAIVVTIFYSFKTSKLAGALLIPYILWTSFAVVLNLSIVVMN